MVNYDIDTTFSALADPNRRRVVELLMHGPTRASEIADGVGLARNATTRHLNTLRHAGLVTVAPSDSDARTRVYSLQIEELHILATWISEVESNWRNQLKRFKQYVEDQNVE